MNHMCALKMILVNSDYKILENSLILYFTMSSLSEHYGMGNVQYKAIRLILNCWYSDGYKLRPSRTYTASKEISWILLTMTIKLMLSRPLIRLLCTSLTF